MRNIAELRDQANVLIEENKVLLDKAQREGRELTPAELQKFDDTMLSINKRKKDIEEETKRQANILGNTGSGPRFMMGDGDNTMIKRGDSMKGEIRLYKRGEDMREGRDFKLPGSTKATDYNIGRYLRGLATGQWDSPEKELRDLYQNSDIAGGYIVPEVLSSELITGAFNQAAVAKAGARQFDMTAETVSMARLDNMPEGEWVVESEALTEDTGMSFGKLTMRERTAGILVKISEDLLRNGQNAATVLQSALSEALALKIDYAALFGAGAAAEPQGLYHIPTADGMNEYSLGTDGASFFLDSVLTGWGYMMDANSPDEGISMIYNSREATTMAKFKSGEGEYITAINGMPDQIQRMNKFVSNQIPRTLTHGISTDCSAIFLGKFENLLIGNRLSGMQLKIGAGTDEFKKRQVLYRLTWTGDILCIRPSWFCRIVGIR